MLRLQSLPLRERGLKFCCVSASSTALVVAPPAGAWIEIATCPASYLTAASLPLRERGLKFLQRGIAERKHMSLPLRERGLKFHMLNDTRFVARVAPPAGAWIEIICGLPSSAYKLVAPPAGAWIEIAV